MSAGVNCRRALQAVIELAQKFIVVVAEGGRRDGSGVGDFAVDMAVTVTGFPRRPGLTISRARRIIGL